MKLCAFNTQAAKQENKPSLLPSCLSYSVGLHLLQGVILGYVVWKQIEFDKTLFTVSQHILVE